MKGRLSRVPRKRSQVRNPATAGYVADIVSGCLILAFGVPFVPFYPPTAAAFVAIAAYYAIASLRDLHGSGRKKSVAIESELPRFVSYIRQSLKNNNNALLLLERYMTDNTAFSEELDRTLADIKTSNFETALLRLNSRYISEHLSMVVHGLAGVFNGDDMHHYFELLERDLTEIEINRLRREIGKIPGRMRKSMALLYAAIVIILFTPILIMIIENLRRFSPDANAFPFENRHQSASRCDKSHTNAGDEDAGRKEQMAGLIKRHATC